MKSVFYFIISIDMPCTNNVFSSQYKYDTLEMCRKDANELSRWYQKYTSGYCALYDTGVEIESWYF